MSVLPQATGFALVLFIVGGSSFNLDTDLYTRYRGDPGSMFGFSVSMHIEDGISRVLVGAPKAQTEQPGVTKGGAVYTCDISSGSSCTQIPFDLNGPATNSRGHPVDSKSNQWFGASVYSAGENGPVVACAPMYIYYSVDNTRREPVGTCFLARNQFSNFSEYSPCRTRNWGYFRQGFCQVGFGVLISRDGQRLFIGAVGSRHWQGELYSVDAKKRLPFLPPILKTLNDNEGMLVSWNLHSRPDVISTNEDPPSEDGSYLGYSMAVGDFGGSVAGHEDVAVGRPRGADLLGQVLLFTWNTSSIQNITGEQLGAYFGYAIASGDIDGDKKDDLIIGAPFYTDYKNNEGKYETGRVYIIYQGNQVVRFNKFHVKDGRNTKGRFGLSVASLGDINNDGYGDFAVGAPYDGPEERGAVYIFHGSSNGVRETHSQVIFSENIVGNPSTFGFSIAGKMDLDRNGYPDLIVGAYDSDTVVYLRAKPVVKMNAYISFAGNAKQIGLDEKNCTLRDGTKVPCIQLSSCLQYEGIGVDRTLDFEVQYVLDSKKTKSPRMLFLSDENRSVMNKSLRLMKGQKLCENMLVFLKTNIRDKLTSIDAEIRYSLLTNYTSRLNPVLDLNQELSRKDSISIKKNCGNDNICIPDLRLIAQTNVQRYLLGSGERLNLNVLVQNEGEDAFEATFETSIPPGLNYVKIERIDDAEREIPVQCSAPSFLNNNTLHCDIGNPLPKEKLVEFRVILQPYHQDGMNPRYEFYINVNSTNPESSSSVSDNFKKITVPIWVETDLILQGSSHPADVHYNSSLYEKINNFSHETEIGPQVIHVYGIRNKGPSDIVEAVAYFLWPSYTLAGDHLLYLLEQPETLGNIKCDYVEEVNVENIALDRKKKSFLDPHAEIGIQAGLHSDFGSSSSTKHQSGSSSKSAKETYTSSSSSYSHSSSQGRVVTEEERRRFEETARRENEEAARETGDGSFRHMERAKGKEVHEHSHYSSNGGRLVSESHSRPVYLEERGRVEISKVPVVSEGSYFHQGSRKQETTGSRQKSASRGGGKGHSYYEEKEQISNTTWKSGQSPKKSVSNKWKTVEDGVEKSGSSSHVESVNGGGNINLSNMDISSVGNRKYTISGGGSEVIYSQETHERKINENSKIKGISQGSSSQSEVNRGASGTRTFTERGGSEISSQDKDRKIWGSAHEGASQGTFEGSSSYPRQNSGIDQTRYSKEKHHNKQTSYGEEAMIGNRRIHDGKGGHRSEESFSGGSKKTEGKHKVHWSSENSRGSEIIKENEESGVNINADDEMKRVSDVNTYGKGMREEGKSYSEERQFQWNTSWNSADGGIPKTTESKSWKINEDGTIINGSSIDTYEGTAKIDKNINKHLTVANVGSAGIDIDQNFVRTGKEGTIYSEEKETAYNTTWNSARGGKPVTRAQSKWKVNKDGKISSGSSSDVYEGTAPPHFIESDIQGGSYESRRYGTNREIKHEENKNHHVEGQTENRGSQGAISSTYEGTSRHGHGSAASGYESSSHHQGHSEMRHDSLHHSRDHVSAGSEYDSSSHQQGHLGQHSSGGSMKAEKQEGSISEGRHGTRHEGSRQHSGTTNINLSEILKENQATGSHQSAGFNQLGDIARGPSDGVARTYGLDLGLYSGNQDQSQYRGAASDSDLRSSHYSSERSGSTLGTVVSGHDDTNGYSYRNSDRLEGYSGSGKSHSSWSSSYTSATADGDRPQHGGAYGAKVSAAAHHRQISDEANRGKFQLYPRYKRDTSEDLEKSLNCGPTDCTRIKCTLGPLKKDEEVWVAFRSRVWVPTMKKLSTSVEVGLSSLVAAKVTKLPHIGSPDVVTTHTHEVHSKIMPPESSVKPDIIPLWIVVVSACAGAIILMLLVYLLYKCGFFKRNRPSDVPEKQPLNRNGHYHGDEAL
ncbi:integrin alpha-PS2 isoform X2 [Halyomorpha halys]|uniref:integrin alpha-PS2 isoform X2 n=1 Tax=Halyomorpha halys TaxID=286706 RepID=UPI0006D4FDD2|nr:integrin alpha-PS2 isoform X2 [Halyomorpha halys]